MTELQQSKPYANYIRALGWKVIIHDRQYYFVRPFPFIGALLKIQRVTKLPEIRSLLPILEREHVGRLAIEPDMNIRQKDFNHWLKKIPSFIHINTDPFIPTKTIRIDLSPSEENIFNRFSEAKRRAVRRALNNNIRIEISSDIRNLISIKNQSAGFLGFITTYGLDKLWPQFAPKNAAILLAKTAKGNVVGGVLLLYWKGLAYYWVAGATKEGKRLFAPTLLVWEALKVSKKRGSTSFDFVGVWDERMANKNTEWKGFTKFKEGFGGKEFYYPVIGLQTQNFLGRRAAK